MTAEDADARPQLDHDVPVAEMDAGVLKKKEDAGVLHQGEEANAPTAEKNNNTLQTKNDAEGQTRSTLARLLFDCTADVEEASGAPEGETSLLVSDLCCAPDSNQIDSRALKFTLSDDGQDLDGDDPTVESSLGDISRRIVIVTTAALPWRTGTAVNPLLRALYLTRGRPKHFVTLFIPWLEEEQFRIQLYGKENAFRNMGEQEDWIRTYAKERAHCIDEADALKILFYPAHYVKAFGSIFPLVDICSLIPNSEADIAILEEPEHLNWFRVPAPSTSTEVVRKPKKKHTGENEAESLPSGQDRSLLDSVGSMGTVDIEIEEEKNNELGWAHKFNFVVGVIHTNYSAYMKEYAVGTSIVAAPAIAALSALVVRAYCHKVIKLSDVLPSLAPGKEITCNVHGVRSEFYTVPENEENNVHDEAENFASIYFIGKLMWAKGFDHMLELQELHRKKTGNYFSVDVYGAGPDEKSIRRAFYGRNSSMSSSDDIKAKPKINEETKSNVSSPSNASNVTTGISLQHVLHYPFSIRAQSEEILSKNMSRLHTSSDDSSFIEQGFEATPAVTTDINETNISVMETIKSTERRGETNPLSVLGEFSGKSVETGIATSHAVYNLADSAIKASLAMTFQPEESNAKDNEKKGKTAPSYIFDPPKSRFEWRRHPIPARFLGVKDHAFLKYIKQHKIFLNVSVTEVLCTTTAEALAMNKFAIIPKHASNTFFLQFPNCLAYDTYEECVEKIQWAIEHEPEPLSPELAHIFTWEAATERLIESSIVTKKEARQRKLDGMDRNDARIAWFHTESTKKGRYIKHLFGGGGGHPGNSRATSPVRATGENDQSIK